ncbi:hypothetical protein ACJ72_03413 [Emergomyces africanus]|uniref:Killer toxin Kp4 domain-containing protein n=1 Tax=Emergomyces africanus TaxID=1955775 RepID=A0A1B7NZQ1_9EURO|nr:hypothetical protein ACJ72_03413 [Emergomyces africanus]
MKLSLVGFVALLATAATATPVEAAVDQSVNAAAPWICAKNDNGGHDMLRRVHSQFNRKFGAPRLNIAGGQCYTVICYNHYFGVCNRGLRTTLELSGDRNVAKNTNPGRKSGCVLMPRPTTHNFLEYVYGHVNHRQRAAKDTVRYC